MSMQIRPAQAADAEACGRIIFKAFEGIARSHGFAPDFPSADAAIGLARAQIADPSIFGVVAEEGGSIIGSNFLREGDDIRGVGPITVEPNAQGGGIGRRLMQAVLERANGAPGIRLLQDSFNMRSIALYASLGFEVREPLLVMAGRPAGRPSAGATVRPMGEADLDACDRLCNRIHGISRRGELAGALSALAPMVVERDGRVAGYMTAPGFWIANHGVADSEEDLQDIILGAASAGPVSFLLPMRQTALFAWCLGRGLRAMKPMTLMTIGRYRTPDRPYLPSVFY